MFLYRVKYHNNKGNSIHQPLSDNNDYGLPPTLVKENQLKLNHMSLNVKYHTIKSQGQYYTTCLKYI